MLFLTSDSISVLLLLASFSLAAEVKLGNTTIIGTNSPDTGLERFAGIPFAEPPIGNLRLKPPVLKTSYDGQGELDASTYGPSCLQPPGGSPVSEDCLTLNIWRPEGIDANAKLPIQFWTFGGGFSFGGSNANDGSLLVAQSVERNTPIIFVNHNYRLGPLGFPQGEEAKREDALNLGLKDHVAALKWVQENIEAFGGDKTKVTISGFSAGSMTSAVQLLNPNFTSLARGAILQSGTASTPLPNTADAREQVWHDFVAAIPECASVAASSQTFDCLRNLPASSTSLSEHIMPALTSPKEIFPWVPTVDEGAEGGVYPDFPSKLFARGQYAKVPVLAGTSLDEGTAFVSPYAAVDWTREAIHSAIRTNFSPPLVPEDEWEQAITSLIDSYPFDDPSFGSPFNTGNNTFGLSPGYKIMSAITGDLFFASQHRLWAKQYASAGSKWFGYLFTQPQPQNPGFIGVTHGSDQSYFFGGYNQNNPSDVKLAEIMRDYWISFVVSQDPNDDSGTERPVWDPYTTDEEVLMQLNGNNLTMIPDNFRQQQIALANEEPLVFHH